MDVVNKLFNRHIGKSIDVNTVTGAMPFCQNNAKKWLIKNTLRSVQFFCAANAFDIHSHHI